MPNDAPTCYDLLDRHVVGGRADAVAVRGGATSWTYARLLEEVSAFGGVLRHCGVVAGDRVVVALPDSLDAVVAVLACGRLGAEHALSDRTAGEKVLVTASDHPVLSGEGPDAVVVLVRQRAGHEADLREDRDYDLDVVLRAGRTDPAASLEEAVLDPWDDRTRVLVGPLLDGGTVELPA